MTEGWLDTYYEEDPPPGYTRDYNSPNVRGIVTIVVYPILFLLATILGGVRVYTKAFITRALGWDDYTCILAMVGNVIWTIAAINRARAGMGRHEWDVHITNRAWENFGRNQDTGNVAYFLTIMLVKMSILFLYLRTFREGRIFAITVYAVLFVLVTSHIGFIFAYLFAYLPVRCSWAQYETDEEWEAHCRRGYDLKILTGLTIFISALTVVLDLVILALPCRAVWRLHLPKRQKLAILFTLLSGVVVTIASILRLVFLIQRLYFIDDDTFTAWRVNFISTVEIDVALICICLPVLKAFTRRCFPSLLWLFTSSGEEYGGGGSSRAATRPKSHQLSSQFAARVNRKRNADSHEEGLVSCAAYQELAEDGKSDQMIALNVIQVKTDVEVRSNSEVEKGNAGMGKGV